MTARTDLHKLFFFFRIKSDAVAESKEEMESVQCFALTPHMDENYRQLQSLFFK